MTTQALAFLHIFNKHSSLWAPPAGHMTELHMFSLHNLLFSPAITQWWPGAKEEPCLHCMQTCEVQNPHRHTDGPKIYYDNHNVLAQITATAVQTGRLIKRYCIHGPSFNLELTECISHVSPWETVLWQWFRIYSPTRYQCICLFHWK